MLRIAQARIADNACHSWWAWLTSVILLAGFACDPSLARGAVTASHISSPSGPAYAFNDTPPGSFTDLAIHGTYAGSSLERLAINCYAADGSHQTVAEDVEGVSGTFSAAVSSATLLGGPPCVLRAVSEQDFGSYPPGSETPFQGPTIAPSELYLSTLSGTPFDYDLVSTTLLDSYEFASVGACGLGSSHLFLPTTLAESEASFECDAALYSEESIEGLEASESEIHIDGVNAFGPYAAEHLLGPRPGVPALEVTDTFDPATGLTRIHETDPLVKCAPDPASFPPTASSCSSFVSTGVSLLRTWETADSGQLVNLTDSWTSTDGEGHSVVALYDDRLHSGVPAAAGLLFPGSSSFSDYPVGATVTLPPGPGSIYYTQDTSIPAAGDGRHPYVAISYDSAPNGPVSVTYDDMGGSNVTDFVMPYRRTIPPGGAFTMRMGFDQAFALGDAQTRAAEAVAAYSPWVSIASPTNRAVLASSTLSVSGEAGGDGALPAVTVDGAPVTVSSDGTWSTTLTLAPGSNTIAATATGEAGLASTRTVTIVYRPPTPPAEPQPVSSETALAEVSLSSNPFEGQSPQEPVTLPAGGFTSVVTARASIIGRVRASRRRVTYTVACEGPHGATCDIASLIQAIGASPHAVTVGSGAVLVSARHHAKIAIRLEAATLRLLENEPSPQMELTVTMLVGTERRTVLARRIALPERTRRAQRVQ